MYPIVLALLWWTLFARTLAGMTSDLRSPNDSRRHRCSPFPRAASTTPRRITATRRGSTAMRWKHAADLPRRPERSRRTPVGGRGGRKRRRNRSRCRGPTRVDQMGQHHPTVSMNGRARVFEYDLIADAARVDLGLFLLGSMRVERDFQYADRHRQPLALGAVRAAGDGPLARSARASRSEGTAGASRYAQCVDHRGASLASSPGRLRPPGGIGVDSTSRTAVARCARYAHPRGARRCSPSRSIADRRCRLALGARNECDPFYSSHCHHRPAAQPAHSSRNLHARLLIVPGRDAPRLHVDARPLARARGSRRRAPLVAREVDGRPAGVRHVFRPRHVGVSSMMRPIWRADMSAFAIASALRKLGPRGDVSHEEALGGQADREAANEYADLVDASLTRRRRSARRGFAARAGANRASRAPASA